MENNPARLRGCAQQACRSLQPAPVALPHWESWYFPVQSLRLDHRLDTRGSGAIDKAECVAFDAGGNPLSDLVDSRVGPESQRVQVQGTQIVGLGLLELTGLLEGGGKPEAGIGMSLMRVCIGTSDFVGEPYYTYDDVPDGETDPELTRFAIDKDRAYVLPTIQLALKKNPRLLLFASPWSPPAWMKYNKHYACTVSPETRRGGPPAASCSRA